jgi:hypothetical protein
MRIISQNGNTDLNYDNCVVVVDENIIEARVGDEIYNLAMYSSEETAKQVFKRLHNRYLSSNIGLDNSQVIFRFPNEE